MPSYYNSFGHSQGIKAVSKRGEFGQSWLGRAWCSLVDRTEPGAGTTRGRSLARGQHVQSITVQPGIISGFVMDYSLYQVLIELPVLRDEQWDRLFTALQRTPAVTAQLLGGQFSEELLHLAEQARVPLLPTAFGMFEISCGCYHWERPCKHVSAVHYLVGEELDRDPALLWEFRGLDRSEFLARLSGGDAVDLPFAASRQNRAPHAVMHAADKDPLPVDPAAFWYGAPVSPDLLAAAERPSAPIELAPFPFWAGARPLPTVLDAQYAKAARSAREMLRATPILRNDEPPTT